MSLRTKGLILIVLISLFPLLLAGVGNYSAVKKAMLQSETERIGSRQDNMARSLSSWMDIRKAEVLVMSRTSIIRSGSSKERLAYFQSELVRSDFTYQAIGFINDDGLAIRSDGSSVDMGMEPFYLSAFGGKVTVSNPYSPAFSSEYQIFVAAPVYNEDSSIEGVIYVSFPFEAFQKLYQMDEEASMQRLYTDDGMILNDAVIDSASSGKAVNALYADSVLQYAADDLLDGGRGNVEIRTGGDSVMVFFSKIEGTPWRLALQEPMSEMKSLLKPMLWRIVTPIAAAECIIAIFFYLYFERIVKRLEAILKVTEQAAAGDFESNHLDISQNDEIGQLADSVNGMMEHLQEMFDRLDAIINQNQYGFIVLDENYQVTYLNKAAEEMLGYKTEELSGHATPLTFMDKEDIAQEAQRLTALLGREVLPGLDVFRALREQNFSYEREWTFVHKTGARIPMLHSSNGLRDRRGRFSGVVGMVHDISDRKQVEKARNRLLNIVESAKDLIASVDRHGNIIYMNRAGREMMGLPDTQAADTIDHYVEPQLYEQLINGARQASELGFWEGGAQLLSMNGDKVHVSIVVVAHRDPDDSEIFYSCIARDITQQKLVQEELIRTTLEAEEANKAKSRFLALMSHEVRTPLNGIIGLTQLMQKTEMSAIQKDYLDKMHMSSETLLHIINDILDFSKIEAGKIEVERQPFLLHELLHRLANQLSVFLGGKKQLEFMINVPKELPHLLLGDAMRLEQVLLNLCMNAIKFTDQGIVILRLNLLETTALRQVIGFEIEDTGIGMTQSQVESLFKPFTQADSSTTRKFGGTGLGLVISKNLVELMGGQLAVFSDHGEGSTFSFSLPFPAAICELESGREEPLFKNRHVWVVEDNEQMREHWLSMLESIGVDTIEFPSWHSAEERLQRIGRGARPTLVLMDMEMPDMYGIDTWAEFRRIAEEQEVPIIAMTTTYGRDELLKLPSLLHPFSILTKPTTRQSFLGIVSDAIRRVCDEEGQVRVSQAQLETAGSDEELPLVAEGDRSSQEQETVPRILLAEDNKINQLVALEMLKAYGCETGLAENGQEALKMLEQQSWDLILMDIHMPVMDGTEAARIIRNDRRYDHIPILAVTANILKKDHDRYLKLGMNAVMTKPLNEEELGREISYWLEQGKKLAIHDERKLRLPAAQPTDYSRVAKIDIDGMDVESALERVNGKRPILRHMMEQFALDYDLFMNQLRLMIRHKDQKSALRMLHTLKGAAGYLSADRLAAAAAKADLILREDESDEEKLHSALFQLERELLTLLAGLQEAKAKFDTIL
ncbi:response regulator [Paenibacillus sp. HB172176]|uniref:response regulator n=1 Tax=Paenibacillus sp. HB172176 TaxID=2493690 RepID=UPI001F0D6EF0|nr:response regulator [Paenibacillus sp. HB172176]